MAKKQTKTKAPALPQRVLLRVAGSGNDIWLEAYYDNQLSAIDDGQTVGIYELVDVRTKQSRHELI
jgi:hypothetical protein